MPDPQFNAKVISADGTMLLFIRGPIDVEGGMGFEIQIVPVAAMPVVEMANWPVMWKGGGDERT